jgi:hypothetical protein
MKWRAIVGVVVLLLLTFAGIGLVHDWRMESDFPAIRAKSGEIQVKDLMGEPREVNRPCQAYDTRLTANCDHVFVYRSSLAPLRDKYWLVFFDGNNQATATSSEVEP